MDRRKTIFIAVLVNAGLLVLLFIMALYREEEVPKQAGLSELVQEQKGPLFNDVQEMSPLAQAIEPAVSVEVVHQLPPLALPPPPALPEIALAPSFKAATMEVTVKKGDTLEKIAKAHSTTVDEVLKLNQLPSSFLRIGQVLKVMAVSTSPQPAKPVPSVPEHATQPEYYTVKVGDNPWSIAMKHHLKLDELLKLNQLTEEKARRLKPGDRLRIR